MSNREIRHRDRDPGQFRWNGMVTTRHRWPPLKIVGDLKPVRYLARQLSGDAVFPAAAMAEGAQCRRSFGTWRNLCPPDRSWGAGAAQDVPRDREALPTMSKGNL